MKQIRQRKSPRLAGYDYAENGAYFVTICTHNREMLFGEVVDGEMRLNDVGKVADWGWTQITTHFSQVEINCYVVMPNHVHGIIIIVNGNTVGTTHASSLPHTSRPNGPKRGSLSAIVGSYKSAVTKQINQIFNLDSGHIWQERYHDHIIRNDDTLNKIRGYVQTNPARWQEDTFYMSDKK
jgi:putative transposase